MPGLGGLARAHAQPTPSSHPGPGPLVPDCYRIAFLGSAPVAFWYLRAAHCHQTPYTPACAAPNLIVAERPQPELRYRHRGELESRLVLWTARGQTLDLLICLLDADVGPGPGRGPQCQLQTHGRCAADAPWLRVGPPAPAPSCRPVRSCALTTAIVIMSKRSEASYI